MNLEYPNYKLASLDATTKFFGMAHPYLLKNFHRKKFKISVENISTYQHDDLHNINGNILELRGLIKWPILVHKADLVVDGDTANYDALISATKKIKSFVDYLSNSYDSCNCMYTLYPRTWAGKYVKKENDYKSIKKHPGSNINGNSACFASWRYMIDDFEYANSFRHASYLQLHRWDEKDLPCITTYIKACKQVGMLPRDLKPPTPSDLKKRNILLQFDVFPKKITGNQLFFTLCNIRNIMEKTIIVRAMAHICDFDVHPITAYVLAHKLAHTRYYGHIALRMSAISNIRGWADAIYDLINNNIEDQKPLCQRANWNLWNTIEGQAKKHNSAHVPVNVNDYGYNPETKEVSDAFREAVLNRV